MRTDRLQYLLCVAIILLLVAQYVVTDYHPWDRIFRMLGILVFAGTVLIAGVAHFQGAGKVR